MIRLAHGDTVLEVEETVGNLPLWRVGGRRVLHNAPWRDEPEVQANPDIPLVNKRLAGDFFCMPFGLDDVEGDPIHGHTANSPWQVVEADVAHVHLRLSVPIRGATVDKQVRITGPVLYQTHVIEGGAGEITLAHHPMTHMAEGGRLSFSPKRAVMTDPDPQHTGANLWALNQTRADMHLDCEDGSQWDMRTYPAGNRVEDFAVLAEARGRALGWTVCMRNAEDDMLVILKDARVMPITMLWVSNGARDFAPWNSRHTGVIGIEDGCAAGGIGLRGAMDDNRLTAMGIPTTQALGGRLVTRHAMISLPRPPGWSEVADIAITNGQAVLTEVNGATVSVPFDEAFFP